VEFLSPLFLAGLGAAAVPVVIHLIHRRRAKVLPIATLRFLRLIPSRTIRRHHLEEYILMAARILLLALLALAGARPVLKDAAAAGGATATAIVIDDSWSMGLRAGGITRFQEARETAVRVLQTLADGDRAALILTSDPGAMTLSTDRRGLVRRAGAAASSLRAPTLLTGVRKGLELLRDAKEPNRELVIVTDLQRRAVEPLLRGLPVKTGDERIRVLLVDVGVIDPANLSVIDARTGSGVALAGERIDVTARIRNTSRTPERARVALILGGERIAAVDVELGPGETRTVPLSAAVLVPGAEGGRVLLDGDDLAADDVRHFALEVMGKIPVLIVNGDPAPVPYQDEVFFLRAALSPQELGAEEIEGPVRLKTVTADGLDDHDLTPYRVVVLANVETVTERTARNLRAFVTEGGGLLLFIGNRVRPADWNDRLGTDPDHGLLPGTLSPATQRGDDEAALLRLTEFTRDHPLFAGLPEEALADLDRIHSRRALGVDTSNAGGEIVASFAGRVPFLVSKAVGRGRVLLVNTSADADWGNLPLRPLFLPLLHRAIRRLAGRAEEREDRVLGERVPVPGSPAEPPEVTDPRGESSRPTETERTTGQLLYGPLAIPGIYRVRAPRPEDSRLFAANVRAVEGDLRRASPDLLKGRFGEDRFRYVRGGQDIRETLSRSREGRPLWGFLLVAALLVLLFETVFANRVARRRGEAAA